MSEEIKLRIMERIYRKTGVAPLMWTGTEGHVYFTNGQGAMLMAANDLELEDNTSIADNYNPWYPLEQVQENIINLRDEDPLDMELLKSIYESSDSSDIYIACLKLWEKSS